MQGGAHKLTVFTNSLMQGHQLVVSRLTLQLGRATAIGRGHSGVLDEPNHAMATRVTYKWLSFRLTLMRATTQAIGLMHVLSV
jgi:hypothetical protein